MGLEINRSYYIAKEDFRKFSKLSRECGISERIIQLFENGKKVKLYGTLFDRTYSFSKEDDYWIYPNEAIVMFKKHTPLIQEEMDI